MKPTLLIDGDIITYRISAACEKEICWDETEDLWTLHSDMNDARRMFDEWYDELNDRLPNIDTIFCFSPQKNFRYRIWPEYKHNRKGKRKPLVYYHLQHHICEEYSSYVRPDIEADDVLGILATSPHIVKGDKIIVSVDKDFKTVPCTYCNMKTWETTQIDEGEANYWHMYQTLIGDTADGYPGCPKCGPKAAEKILKTTDSITYQSMWPAVVKAYEKQGLGEEYALTMARLARICRRGDYDFKKKEVILWTPEK